MVETPNLDRKFAEIKDRNPQEDYAIRQYREIAGKAVELWSEIDQRTDKSDWRQDGVGSCHTPTYLFQTYLEGFIGFEIEELSDALNSDIPNTNHRACQFHREGTGCILKDLKSPRCIDHVNLSHRTEIQERFGIEIPQFMEPLRRIQTAGFNPEDKGFVLHPEENDELVERVVNETQELIDHVKTFPILHPTIS